LKFKKQYLGALKKSLPNETFTQLDADHMKTTYQADYSDPGEYSKNAMEYIVDITRYICLPICNNN